MPIVKILCVSVEESFSSFKQIVYLTKLEKNEWALDSFSYKAGISPVDRGDIKRLLNDEVSLNSRTKNFKWIQNKLYLGIEILVLGQHLTEIVTQFLKYFKTLTEMVWKSWTLWKNKNASDNFFIDWESNSNFHQYLNPLKVLFNISTN